MYNLFYLSCILACPAHCDTCTEDVNTKNLVCSTCSTGHWKNTFLCGSKSFTNYNRNWLPNDYSQLNYVCTSENLSNWQSTSVKGASYRINLMYTKFGRYFSRTLLKKYMAPLFQNFSLPHLLPNMCRCQGNNGVQQMW